VKTRGLRFYAGVPLIARHGEALGTLCLLDFKPRRFTYFDLELLSVFGKCVLSAMERREKRTATEVPESAFRYLQYIDEELDVFGKAAFNDLATAEGARASEVGDKVSCVAVAVPARRLKATAETLRSRQARSFIGRLGHARLGWLVPGWTAEQSRTAALQAAGPHAFAEAVELDRYPGAARLALATLETALGDAGLA
jgi:GAF domain-containing protein